ncbi:MAG TPA: YceI family protein [Myxococcales bacterium]
MARYVLMPERSRVWAEARSSIHPIRVETAGFEGELEAEVAEGQVCLAPPTRIQLAVELLKSNNSLVDAELRRKLEARKHPRIEGRLREARPLPGSRCLLRGDLTLHGVSRPLEVEALVRAPDPDTLEVEGEKTIDMRDFNLAPPRFLIFKVEPTVRIRAKLVARRATPGH